MRSRILKIPNRFLKFSAVGLSGVIVNNGLLWLLAEFTGLPFYFCSFLAIETSVITNFLLNDNWTWNDKKRGHVLIRLLRYNTSTAFSSLFVNMTVLLLLKEWVGMPYLAANLFGIGCGVVINYLSNSVWTYGEFRFRLPRPVWMIALISLAVRLLLAAGLGAGFDEAYYFAYSTHPSLSYFDHPPVVGFLAGFFPYLTGFVSAFTIRLAAVLLYTVSGLLLYLLARRLSNKSTALWTFFLFNITPIFLLLAGIFILPDAGLVLFWILTLLIFYRLLFETPRTADWALAGLTTGFAMLSKYHGVLPGFFMLLYLLCCDRKKFKTAGPYVYGLIAFTVFSPVLIWNARHDFVSFLFQGGRALSSTLNLDSFFQALGGQTGYLTPMVFIPMVVIIWRVIRQSVMNQDRPARFYLFFGVFPVLLFILVSLYRQILPHWTLAGYILLLIPLSEWIAPAFSDKRWVKNLVYISSALILLLLAVAFLHTKFGVLRLDRLADRGWIKPKQVYKEATLDMVGWQTVPEYLKAQHISPDSVFLFTHKWFLSGETELAVDGQYTVMCFNEKDPRGYGVWDKNADVIGMDGICVYTNRYRIDPQQAFAPYFQSIGKTDSLTVSRGGIQVKTYYFTRCHTLETKYEPPF